MTVDAFDRFWAVYPKRAGANPKHPARVKFAAAVKRGENAEAIIGGAGLYAVEQSKLRQIATSFVAQAVTWLNQRRWQDYPVVFGGNSAEIPATTWITVNDPRWLGAVEIYRREKRKNPPTVPGLGGHGWHFPTSLMDTGNARNANPAQLAEGRGVQSGQSLARGDTDSRPNERECKAGQRGELSDAPNFFD